MNPELWAQILQAHLKNPTLLPPVTVGGGGNAGPASLPGAPGPVGPMAPPSPTMPAVLAAAHDVAPDAGVRALLGQQPPVSGGLLDPNTGWSGMLPADVPSQLPTEPPPGSNLFDRIVWRAKRHLTGDVPPGYEAILGTQGVEQARPGFMDTFLGGARAGDFRHNLDQAIADRTRPMQIEQALQQQAQVKALREKFALPANATPDQVRENMAKFFYEASRLGLDIQGMGGAAAEAMRGINERDMPFTTANAGDQLFTFDKRKGTFAPGPQIGISTDKLAENALDRELKRAQIAATLAMKNATNAEAERKRLDQLKSQFFNQNADVQKSARAIELARTAFDELAAGNVDAYKSAIISFAGVADPKAQLRQGIIQMIEQLDPSVKGKADMALARLTKGNLPPRILKGMIEHVERTRQNMAKLWDQRRQAAGKRVGGLGDYIESGDEIFGAPLTYGGAKQSYLR